jgi:hypothetical protein
MASMSDSVIDFKNMRLATNINKMKMVATHHPTLLSLNLMNAFVVIREYRLYDPLGNIPLRWLQLLHQLLRSLSPRIFLLLQHFMMLLELCAYPGEVT